MLRSMGFLMRKTFSLLTPLTLNPPPLRGCACRRQEVAVKPCWTAAIIEQISAPTLVSTDTSI